jgi:hypothetical protein
LALEGRPALGGGQLGLEPLDAGHPLLELAQEGVGVRDLGDGGGQPLLLGAQPGQLGLERSPVRRHRRLVLELRADAAHDVGACIGSRNRRRTAKALSRRVM